MADARRPASQLARAIDHAPMAEASLAGRRPGSRAPIGGRAGGLAGTVRTAALVGRRSNTTRRARAGGAACHHTSIDPEEEDDTPRPFMNEATVWSGPVARSASAAYPTAYYKYVVRRSSRPVCTCVCHVSIRYAYV